MSLWLNSNRSLCKSYWILVMTNTRFLLHTTSAKKLWISVRHFFALLPPHTPKRTLCQQLLRELLQKPINSTRNELQQLKPNWSFGQKNNLHSFVYSSTILRKLQRSCYNHSISLSLLQDLTTRLWQTKLQDLNVFTNSSYQTPLLGQREQK